MSTPMPNNHEPAWGTPGGTAPFTVVDRRHGANDHEPDWGTPAGSTPDAVDGRRCGPNDQVEHLRAISQALARLKADEKRLRSAVAEARAAGNSWEAIGAVLGTSRQDARKKFG
jgi:hypothetical protein